MNDNNAKLQDSLQEVAPYVSPAAIASDIYKHKLENSIVRAAQEASYYLIDQFNAFCAEHDVKYFAIANTLAGIYSYQDFIPGTTTVEIGMLRSEYEKLESAYYSQNNENADRTAHMSASGYVSKTRGNIVSLFRNFGPDDDKVSELPKDKGSDSLGARIGSLKEAVSKRRATEEKGVAFVPTVLHEGEFVQVVATEQTPLNFTLTSHFDAERKYHTLVPTVQLPGYCMAFDNGQRVFGTDNMPALFAVSIQISVFDALPDDYDFARALFMELKTIVKERDRFENGPMIAYYKLSQQAWKLAGSYNDRPHFEVARLVPTRSREIALADINPTQMKPFGSTELACPCDPKTWVVEDEAVQAEQVKLLQSDAAEIIREIDRICRENGIGYFVCGGTMLGYVRHGGFIPWDDDMDIGMLRSDYNRFLEVAEKQIDTGRFVLQTRASDPNIPYLFSKVRMKNSEYITKYNQFRDFDKGICVDIFPFDRVPFETGELPAFREVVRKVTRAHNKVANRQVGEMPSTEPTSLHERIAREIMSIRHDWYWRKSLAETQRNYEETVTQFNDDENFHFVASHVPSFTMIHLDDLLPYQDVDFDGMTLMCPAKPEVFLQMQYGDYMTMPLPHQQRGHSLIWWSDPEHDAGSFGTKIQEHAPTKRHHSVLLKAAPSAAAVAIGAACLGAFLKLKRR